MRFLPPYLLGVINSFTFFFFFYCRYRKPSYLSQVLLWMVHGKQWSKQGVKSLDTYFQISYFYIWMFTPGLPVFFARVCFIYNHHNLKQNLPNSTSPSIPHFSILNNNLHTKCQSVFCFVLFCFYFTILYWFCHISTSHYWAYTPRKPELKKTLVPQCSL